MASSQFDPDSTPVRPQKSWTSPIYSLMNGLGLKTLLKSIENQAYVAIPWTPKTGVGLRFDLGLTSKTLNLSLFRFNERSESQNLD